MKVESVNKREEGLAPLQLLSQSQVSPLLMRDFSALERLQGGDKSHKSYERSETITLRETITIEQDRICPTFPYQSPARTFEPCSLISSWIALGIYLRERSQLDLKKTFSVTTLGLSVMRFVASVMLQVFHVM